MRKVPTFPNEAQRLESSIRLRFDNVRLINCYRRSNRAISLKRCAPRSLAAALVAARASTAWRYFDGTFMPKSEKEAAGFEEYERYAAGGRARAATAARYEDSTFAPSREVES